MNAAILARSALRTRSTARLMRSDLYHFENTNGQNIPFKTTNKVGLAIKMTLYLGLGFGAPFLGAAWQFHKASSG
ncbi:cytochrome c oxidase subunit VIIc [Umbelopsis sp. AD052]|nr:cytochrome c oxidase subunit VIIc [Umbelopsis sp. AD052]